MKHFFLLCLLASITLLTACENTDPIDNSLGNTNSSIEKEQNMEQGIGQSIVQGMAQAEIIFDPTAPTTTTVPITPATPTTPTEGGRLILASIGEPSNLISYLATDSASHEISAMLYVSLLEYDKDFNVVKLAAEEYSIEEDGKLFRFKLREDIYWQDGTQLTADDVTFTYELIIDPNTPTAYAGDFLAISEYKQTGKFTFEARYEQPYARSIITWMHDILPKHILEGQNIITTDFARNPIGAGPYKLKTWNSGSSIILEANPYYADGKPYIDELIYRIIPDTSTIFLEAKAKQVDFLGLTPQQYLFQTTGSEWDEMWSKYKYLSWAYTYVGFNLRNRLFESKTVRQALSLATDREMIIKGALLGLGESTIGPYKPDTWVYNTDIIPHEYNLEKAKQMLAEEGWTPGKDGILIKDDMRFAFTVLVNQGNEERTKVAIILQQNWQKLGVEISIRTVEWAAFINEFVHKGRYDAVILGWNILDDPDLFNVWHSSSAKENGLNFVYYKNTELDELLEKGRSMVDRDARKIVYDEVQEILHEDQPYIFLYVPYSLPMVQSRFQGIEPASTGITYNMDKWWIPTSLQ